MINNYQDQILNSRLIPLPKATDFLPGFYRLCNSCKVKLSDTGAATAELLVKLFKEYWQISPKVEFVRQKTNEKEAYELSISEDCLSIIINDCISLRYALYTLRQLAEAERNVMKLKNYILPCGNIKDKPELGMRSIHLCVFPETHLDEVRKKIRMAAYYKFNTVVIEFWGTFPFKCCSELCLESWRDKRDALQKIIKEALTTGVTLVPQFNILGHAAAARCGSDKHIILDQAPELEPLFEPEGWSWCLSNTWARKLLTKAVLELHDFFEQPPYFHIGCDEAEDLGHCALCRSKKVRKLVADHIKYFHELFAKRSTQLIMWHDMMLEEGDPNFPDVGTRHGLKEFSFGKLYKEIPKDIIVAVWCYGGKPPVEDYDYKAIRFFKEAGFPVVVSPWNNPEGIRYVIKYGVDKQTAGMLATVWDTDSSTHFFNIYYNSAQTGWRGTFPEQASSRLSFSTHLRQVVKDLNIKDYLHTGSANLQVPLNTLTPLG